ncbi:tyrosine-protein phosphatase non-receptor type 13 [Lepeophtheirus salmonis]|uniref:tyrosine-protein phosphatase non-receptor type 13 n=1 Tax=Lepeophtheirus salmonis TaxID=72036 RepID=UPI001AE93779|nr:tyrosine-protein phosphatase non-receptor type 13-like [Lepeophtheirus salmonis]XP_040573767.1 tyrosine-protein phosphatase non-receptor type 13-like [Lepeophtheirus salmonis]XP_040573769.1 tyrosine-protein phosphatase non-receptor type 13-like [Lepeophtheirus salmonis]
MKKWTTTVTSSQVSLRKAISLRHGPLNEVECWAIISAAASSLGCSNEKFDYHKKPTIYSPENMMLKSNGSIKVSDESFTIGDEYLCPQILTDKKEIPSSEFERIAIYSLAKTIQSASKNAILSNKMENCLNQMMNGGKTANEVHSLASNELKRLVGSILSPEAKFIAQLCKCSLGSSSTSTLNQYRSRPLPSSPIVENNEIEFSRLDTSTSSEASTPPPALPPKRIHTEVVPEVPAKNTRAKTPKTFKRNPSRLYRVVEPLTKISMSPVPATKRCVGPEFFVMSEKSPITLDMTVHSRRDSISKRVTVVMISGQRIVVHVTPSSATAGEVLERSLQALDIKESSLFTLSTMNGLEEYLPLSTDTKLSKVAPSGWKDSTSFNDARCQSSSDSFALYLRFKFFPEDIDTSFKDPNNKHQFYLQCRRDFVQSQFRLSVNQALGLAAMALQVEFGDYNDDIHDGGEYFVLDHYLPREIIKEFGRKEAYAALSQLHKAYFGQSQSKAEVKFCKEIQKLSHYGFHFFTVYENKKIRDGKRLVGIHNQGIFLFDKSFTASAHTVFASYLWNQIVRIQFDKSHFHLVVKSERPTENTKYKFYLPIDIQAKVMFDLSAAHHQRHNQMRYSSSNKTSEADVTAVINYKEPSMSGIRSLKNRILSKRQLSQRKLYTKPATTTEVEKPNSTQQTSNNHQQLKRSTTLASTTVKRLTHYSSMANDLGINGILDTSNKENCTPDKNYRYKVYLEPDDDESSSNNRAQRMPLQEKPIRDFIETPLHRGVTSRRRISTIADHQKRRRSESANPTRRIAMGRLSQCGSQVTSTGMRMGTRISMSALHRERIRFTTDLSTLPPAPKKRNLDLDFDTMEVKSLPQRVLTTYQNVSFPPKPKPVLTKVGNEENNLLPQQNESLSDSLIERFDKMESDESSQPEREIVAVVLSKDSRGRLGVKITGTPSGIYIGDFDPSGVMVVEGRLKSGDRIIAVNGRSLENVSYNQTLELIKKSSKNVQFLVSQIKSS